VESLSEEELNAPVKSESQIAPVWRYINGEICEHYEEHGNLTDHELLTPGVVFCSSLKEASNVFNCSYAL
jgi:hypothetical protein